MKTLSRPLFAKVLLAALLFVFGSLCPAAPQDEASSLNLVFTGSGTVMSNQTSFEHRYNWKTKSYQSGTSTTTVRKPFSGSGFVEIYAGTARIKLPSAMMPLIRGDNDGWFPINDFFMNDREITGVVKINLLNKPALRIDRNTGIITIANSFGDFTGQCELASKAPEKRKF